MSYHQLNTVTIATEGLITEKKDNRTEDNEPITRLFIGASEKEDSFSFCMDATWAVSTCTWVDIKMLLMRY